MNPCRKSIFLLFFLLANFFSVLAQNSASASFSLVMKIGKYRSGKRIERPFEKTFRVGQKVWVRLIGDEPDVTGKISSISDSSFNVGDKKIMFNDVYQIAKTRKRAIVGWSFIVVSASCIAGSIGAFEDAKHVSDFSAIFDTLGGIFLAGVGTATGLVGSYILVHHNYDPPILTNGSKLYAFHSSFHK